MQTYRLAVALLWTILGAGLLATVAHGAEPAMPEIIAHRGASHDAPENTLAALRLGFEQGADAGELDVWVTRDGVPVLLHDADLKRTAGVERKVAEMRLEELRTLDVGKWKDARFAGEKLPTLAEALALLPADKRMFVEIKCGEAGVPAILEAMRASKIPPARLPVIAFSAGVVAAVKKQAPELTVYWIVSLKDAEKKGTKVEDLIAKAQELRADGLDVSTSPIVDRAFVAAVKQANLGLYVWTVDDAQTARQLKELGVAGITTNRPGWLREQLK
jgi:glycerophosphoryl diester phosphodiesterase